jgi:hypothetical protein
MAKEYHWTVTVDGAEHDVTYAQPGARSAGGVLFVDGEENKHIFPRDGFMDEPVYIDGRECRFVLRNYVPDIASEGVFASSGKAYAPNEPIPSWCRTFAAMTILGLLILLRPVWVGAIAGLAVWRGSEYMAQRSGIPARKKTVQYLLFLAAVWTIASIIFLVWGD